MQRFRGGRRWEGNTYSEDLLSELLVDARPVPDRDLAQRARLGDRDALGELYRRHGAAAFSLAARLLGAGEAEDVVHDVFLALPSALASYQERGLFGAWLRRVVARAALTRVRSARRRNETALEDVVVVTEPSGADPDLELAIARLPGTLRTCLVLHAVEGFPHREVASMLGISVIAARVRYSRALNALRRDLRR